MDWVRVRGKQKEIIAIIAVLLVMFGLSLQYATAEESTDAVSEEVTDVVVGDTSDVFGAEALPYTLDSVTWGTGGGDQKTITGDEVAELIDAANSFQFRLNFDGDQPSETELQGNVRIAEMNNSGAPRTQGVTDGVAISYNKDGHGRVTVEGNKLHADTAYFLVVNGAFLGEAEDLAIKFTTEADAQLPPTTWLTKVSYGVGGSGQVDVTGNVISEPLNTAVTNFQFRLIYPSSKPAPALTELEENIRIVLLPDYTDVLFDISRQSGTEVRVMFFDSAPLEPGETYALVLDQSITGGDTDTEISFTVRDNTPPEPTEFLATFCYPVDGSQNAAVDRALIIEFNQDAWKKTVEDAANVVLTCGTDPEPVPVTLSLNGRILTVTPAEALAYGTEYNLALTDAVMSDNRADALTATKITFTTKSFELVDAAAALDADFTTLEGLEVTLRNVVATQKTANIKVEIRRDLGSRLEGGGTVVYIAAFDQNKLAGEATETLTFDALNVDLTKDLYNDANTEVQGDAFLDVYVLNGKGEQIGEALHKKLTVE